VALDAGLAARRASRRSRPRNPRCWWSSARRHLLVTSFAEPWRCMAPIGM
jgi:hypothetical protein